MSNDTNWLDREAVEETEENVFRRLAEAEDVLMDRFNLSREDLRDFVIAGLRAEVLDEDFEIAEYLLCVAVADEYRKMN